MRRAVGFLIRTWSYSPKTWVFVAIALMGIAGFLSSVDEAFDVPDGDDGDPIDAHVANFARNFRHPRLTQIMIDWTALGSMSVLVVFCSAIVAFLFIFRDRIGAAYVFIASFGAAFWPWFLKPLFGRERPDISDRLVHVGDLSFPSGHAFGSTAVYLALAIAISRHFPARIHQVALFAFGFLLITLVGVSRIYLGVHFFNDVVAGIASGAAWSSILAAGLAVVERKKKSHGQ